MRVNAFKIDHLREENQSKLSELLEAYQPLSANKMTELGVAKGVKHRIETVGPPIHLPVRWTPNALKVVTKGEGM